MTDLLAGKVALVTGSSRGIGRAIAQRLAAAGATVIVTARSMDVAAQQARDGGVQHVAGTLAETVALIEAQGGTVFALPTDLTDPAERASLVDRAAELAGGIDILVNNAGFASYSSIETMDDDVFEQTIDHYLRVPFILSRSAIAHMKARGAGWIVNIGSSTGMPPVRPFRDYNKTSGDVVYASMKAALHRFTQGLAAEVQGDGIAVNAVGPSTAIMTPGAADLLPDGYETEPVEYLAETVLAMSHRPAAERTGLVAFSLHYPWAADLPVHSLDGRTQLPRRSPPAWCNPSIRPLGV